jgi:lipoate-protein ligase A
VDDLEIKDWYVWRCQAQNGALNMQIDHFLARHMTKLINNPVLRFFLWKPPCISLGYHQNSGDINHEICQKHGVDLVRRPTGGRAILHANELTYSVIYPSKSVDVSDFYRLIHIPFVKTLKKLGVAAEFESTQADFNQIYRTERASLCFASSARYEVQIDGKKLIGSAQRIYENAILQHGSILLGPEHENLVNFLMISEASKRRMKNYIQQNTSFLWKYDIEVDETSLAKLFEKEYETHYHIKFSDIENNHDIINAFYQQKNNFEIQLHTHQSVVQ